MATIVTVTTTGASSFTIPTGCTSIVFEIWGPGAGGGTAAGAGQEAGGAGGAYKKITYSVTPGDVVYWNVGAGNAAGATTNTTWVQKNTNSSSGAWFVGSASSGTSADGGTQTLGFTGGSGASAQAGGGSRGGSGGGGSATSGGAGSTGTAGSSAVGGAGGAAGTGGGAGGANSSDGVANVEGGGGAGGGAGGGVSGGVGGAPGGGGGGGGSSSGASGAGGRGQLRYTYTVVAVTGGTAGTTVNSGATNSPGLPTHATGDLLLLFACSPKTGATFSLSGVSGWAQYGSTVVNTADNGATACFWKIATSSSETAPTVTYGGTGGNNDNVAYVLGFTGTDQTNPFDDDSAGVAPGSTNSYTAGAITFAAANGMRVVHIAQRGGVDSWTAGGMTLSVSRNGSANATRQATWYLAASSSGSTGTTTHTNASASYDIETFVLGLRVPAAPTVTERCYTFIF